MIIHVVKEGDTMQSISDEYNIPINNLIEQNGITNPNDLVIGQTIVIVYPQITYTVKNGDTLRSIANLFYVDVMQILRNNPSISNRDLIPGETIIISFNTKKERSIDVSGFAYPYIDENILKKTLPFLTYLTVFNYQITKDGDLKDIDDSEVIQIAKNYRVAPMMFVSVLSESGIGEREVSETLINNELMQNKLINNIVVMLKRKGYYGLNHNFQYITYENQELVVNYVKKLSDRLHEEGFRFVISVSPKLRIERLESFVDAIAYSELAKYADALLFLSYEWAASYEAPGSITSVSIQRQILDYTTKQVPPEKIILGMPIIGYDWKLPYIKGETVANAVTTTTAIELAVVQNVSIQYNSIPEAPYFFYYTEAKELHIVWFKDARSIDAITELITEYGLFGTSIWNIMQFFAQMWFIINTKFDIGRVL